MVFHAFIPHLHHEQLTDASNSYFHKNFRNLFDAVKLGFHEDLKVKFENSNKLIEKVHFKKINFEKYCLVWSYQLQKSLLKKNYFFFSYLTTNKQYYFSSKLLRAPPLDV